MSVRAPEASIDVKGSWRDVLLSARAELEARLAAYVGARRWFRGKSRVIERARVTNAATFGEGAGETLLLVVTVSYAAGASEDYVLPVTFLEGDDARAVMKNRPDALVAHLSVHSPAAASGVLCDALAVPSTAGALLDRVARDVTVDAARGRLRFRRMGAWPEGRPAPRILDAEQTNTSIVFEPDFILKIVRRLEEGKSPDLEMAEFLTSAGYTHTPAILGAIDLLSGQGSSTVGILTRFVPNEGDAWRFFLGMVHGYVERPPEDAALPAEQASLVKRLAERVAEMHMALASRTDVSAFAPEVIDHREREELASATQRSLDAVCLAMAEKRATLPAAAQAAIDAVLRQKADLSLRLRAFAELGTDPPKTRVHGDLHLGQVLFTGDDFVLIDFEGEPARPLSERRRKRSPLADVAGMIRSLHYASVAAVRTGGASPAGASERARGWYREAEHAFTTAYFATASKDPLLPSARVALDFYLVEKCVYEVQYELDNRPDWVAIPLVGLEALLGE